jgi:hypothetical protein
MRSCFSFDVALRKAGHGFYLRQQLERPLACVLHRAKHHDYSLGKDLTLPSTMRYKTLPQNLYVRFSLKAHMTQANATSARRLASLSHRSISLTFSCIAFALFLLASPEDTLAKSASDSKTTSTSNPTKKKGASKAIYQGSPSEETRAERDRRMYRECKGLHNAGACRGYTR